MLAGSHEEVSHLAVEMVKGEASAPQATVVGQSLRASPQLSAPPTVSPRMRWTDFTLSSGQAAAAVIPAILPVARDGSCDAGRDDRSLYCRRRGCRGSCVRTRIGVRCLTPGIRPASSGDRWRLRRRGRACMKVPAAAIPDVIGISRVARAGGFGARTSAP